MDEDEGLIDRETRGQLLLAGALVLVGFGAIVAGALKQRLPIALLGIGLLVVGSVVLGIRLYGSDD